MLGPRNHHLCALVLALFVLGWFADRAHVALERHAWCPEHQRVEHDGAGHAADADGLHAAGDPRGPGVHDPGDSDAPHAECCLLLARGGDPVLLPPCHGVAPWPPADDGRALVSSNDPAARTQVPLVLLAPKQSPPAA